MYFCNSKPYQDIEHFHYLREFLHAASKYISSPNPVYNHGYDFFTRN